MTPWAAAKPVEIGAVRVTLNTTPDRRGTASVSTLTNKGNRSFKSTKATRPKMMPFSPALAEKVVAGTSQGSFRLRLYPFYPKPGETFRARSNNAELPGLYRCRRIIRNLTFEKLRQGRWREVGVNTPEDYLDILEDVTHRDELNFEQPGYFFQFERLDSEDDTGA